MTAMLHIDAHVIVCIKPPGLLCVPGRGADKQDCLSARLAASWGEIHIAHRLDQATSGVMVFARTASALKHLHAQFREGSIDKAYEAIVSGNPCATSGKSDLTIHFPLMADWPNRPKQKVDTVNGKPCTTHAQILSFDAATQTSRMHLIPITGRTHQLRVHMMAMGHPIVGDALYGSDVSDSYLRCDVPTGSEIQTLRLLLHAKSLTFTHPATGERYTFESKPDF